MTRIADMFTEIATRAREIKDAERPCEHTWQPAEGGGRYCTKCSVQEIDWTPEYDAA